MGFKDITMTEFYIFQCVFVVTLLDNNFISLNNNTAAYTNVLKLNFIKCEIVFYNDCLTVTTISPPKGWVHFNKPMTFS